MSATIHRYGWPVFVAGLIFTVESTINIVQTILGAL